MTYSLYLLGMHSHNTNVIEYNQPHQLLQYFHRCGSKIEEQNGEKGNLLEKLVHISPHRVSI